MESELSAKYYSHSDEKNDRFTGRKRNSKNVKENYLFRRVLNGKTLGRYEEMANSYYNMMSFNWEDERLLKNRASILSNLSSSAYWFYICSMYFPYCQNEFLTDNKFELIPETFNKILDRIILNKKNLKKKSYINTKLKFLNDIKSFVEDEAEKQCVDGVDGINFVENSLKVDDQTEFEAILGVELELPEEIARISKKHESTVSISIDAYIESMESSLSKLNNSNNSLFKALTQQLKENVGKLSLLDGKEYSYDPDDVLSDLKYLDTNSKHFQRYLINKHEAKTNISNICMEFEKKSNSCILSRLEEEELNNNPDDIVCVVCNDGDYEDDDLIVYCSSCQMTVHQSCYGIVVLPKEDWICHPCIAFGLENSKLIQCVCCPVKGGAMKPTMLKKSSNFYSYVSNLKKKEENESVFKFNMIDGKPNKSISTYPSGDELEIFRKKSEKILFSDYASKEIDPIQASSISTSIKDHEDFKLNKNNNLILNGCSSVNLITSCLNPSGFNQSKTDAENSESISTFLNEVESKKTLSSIFNSKQRKRGRQRKTSKSKNKNKIEETSKAKEKTNSELIISTKILNENSWIHLSCALWTPEIIIQDFARKDEIKKSIDKKRFQEKCNICGLSSQGPTMKCENDKCNLKFHIECARINKYQLEMVNNSLGEVKYYIYCQKHRPHRLIKNIELRQHRAIDDIEQFGKILDRNYEVLSKYDKRNEFTVFVSRKTGILDESGSKRNVFEHQNKNKIKFLSKKMKAKLLNVIREQAKKISNINVVIKKVKINPDSDTANNMDVETEPNKVEDAKMDLDYGQIEEEKETEGKLINEKSNNDYEYVIKTIKERINLTYSDTLNPNFFPWFMIKGFSNLTPFDLHRIYMNELVPDESHYSKLILKKNFTAKKKTQKKLSKKKKLRGNGACFVFNYAVNAEVPKINNEEIFCYCRLPFYGDYMIECQYGEQGGNKCIHNGWVHPGCVDELKDLDKATIEDENFVFICKECKEKYEENLEEIKK